MSHIHTWLVLKVTKTCAVLKVYYNIIKGLGTLLIASFAVRFVCHNFQSLGDRYQDTCLVNDAESDSAKILTSKFKNVVTVHVQKQKTCTQRNSTKILNFMLKNVVTVHAQNRQTCPTGQD